MGTTDRIMSGWQLVCFSALSAPLAMVSFAVVSFVPTFYAIDMGLGLAVVGAVFMFGRFFDVFTDPLIGALSDRTGGARGPRVPWMVLSFPGVLLFAWLLLAPQDAVGPIYLFCVVSGYLLFVTAFDVPYSSIGLEISPNVHERSVLAGTKAVFQILGALAASLAPLIIGSQMGVSLATLALAFLITMPVALAVFFIWAPRRTHPVVQTRMSPWTAWRNCLQERAFRKLMIVFFAVQAANAMTVGLLVLFVTHVLKAPAMVGQMFLLLLVGTAFFVPLWILLSKKIGKRKTWACAIMICTGVLSACYAVGVGDTVMMQAICVGLGACMTCDAVMPTSMLADIVARDEADSGHPRAASYLALKNAASKMAFVAPMGIAFPILGMAGFDKSGADGPESIGLLLFFFTGLPGVLRLAVAGYLWFQSDDLTEAATAS
ncbi:MFS transporter [uncultured Pelagimonas sp.]|uniref:MFS transporter n=1 Tax=uncultured Pelagimonas sp. TaxID=1618102 RepID=UPI00262F9BA3|nr:MFS transporter [uncultured Pelagimonas sp.]